MKTILLAFAFLLPLAPAASAEDPPAKPVLPDGVAAIVHGERVSMEQFRETLVRRFRATETGQKALDDLVERTLIAVEAEDRDVEVDDDEVEEYLEKVEKDVVRASGGTQTLARLLEEKGVSREEFLRVSREFLLRQKMAAEDLGTDGEVGTAQLGVWITDLKRKRGVKVGTPDLPAGVLARVGDRDVDAAAFGEALLGALTPAELESALWDMAVTIVVRKDLAAAGLRTEAADVDAALADLKEEFQSDPRFKDTAFTFEQYVQGVRRMTVEELRSDPQFLAQVGLGKKIRLALTEEEIAAYFEEHRLRYGEERTFIHLLVKASDRETAFSRGGQSRSYEDAKTMIDALYARYLRGTPFEKLVAEASEDRTNYSRAERTIVVNRETPLPDALRAKVFEAPPGEVVGPVRTPFGWHLVKVVQTRPAREYAEAKPEVVRDLVREKRTRALLELRQDKDILLRY